MNNEVIVPVLERTVKAWSDLTGSVEFKSLASTGSQLKSELREHGFNLTSMKISEGRTSTKITDETILPVNISLNGQLTNDLIILVLPDKIDLGMLSYKEAKTELKDIFDKDEAFKILVKETKGNWTQFTTEQLNEVLSWYSNNNKKKTKKETKKTATPNSLNRVTKTAEEPVISINKVKDAINEIYNGINTLLSGVALFNSAMSQNTVSDVTDSELEEMAKKFRG